MGNSLLQWLNWLITLATLAWSITIYLKHIRRLNSQQKSLNEQNTRLNEQQTLLNEQLKKINDHVVAVLFHLLYTAAYFEQSNFVVNIRKIILISTLLKSTLSEKSRLLI